MPKPGVAVSLSQSDPCTEGVLDLWEAGRTARWLRAGRVEEDVPLDILIRPGGEMARHLSHNLTDDSSQQVSRKPTEALARPGVVEWDGIDSVFQEGDQEATEPDGLLAPPLSHVDTSEVVALLDSVEQHEW